MMFDKKEVPIVNEESILFVEFYWNRSSDAASLLHEAKLQP